MSAEGSPAELRIAHIGVVADVPPDSLVADAAVIVLERRLAQLGLVADIHARTVDESARTLTSTRWWRADAPWSAPINLVVVEDSVTLDDVDDGLVPSGVPVVPVTWCDVGDDLVDELRRLLDPSTVEVRRSVLTHLDIAPTSAIDAAVSRGRKPQRDDVEKTLATALGQIVDHLAHLPAITPDQLAAALRSLDQRHRDERRADAALLDAARFRLDELGDECERLRRRVDELGSHDAR